MPSNYERLAWDSVLTTVSRLVERIEARFQGRNLANVARTVASTVSTIGRRTDRRRETTQRWEIISRVGIAVVLVAAVLALWLSFGDTFRGDGPERSFEWVPLIESTVNDVVFAAIAVWFLHGLPARMERRATLAVLHRLRSLAHIIDMHQLTKDPERLLAGYQPTEHSADPRMSAAELRAYLDYCSELLSLVGKAAALCAEETSDAVVLNTVSTIEQMTTGMSNKIWQKISLLPG